MPRKRLDEELILHCDCTAPRCLVQFLFDNSEDWGPELLFNIEYCNFKFWDRVRGAFKILFTGRETRSADVLLIGFDNIREIKEFCIKCLKRDLDKRQEDLIG